MLHNYLILKYYHHGYAIRAIRHHIRSKKFIIEEGGNKEILAKFAIQVWNLVRIKESVDEIENEIDKWEWLMSQKKLELISKEVSLVKKNRFHGNFSDNDLYDLPDMNF